MNMINKLPRKDNGWLMSYAWPGGYPVFYLDGDNAILCPDCANACEADPIESFRPNGFGVHFEGEPLVCDQCGVEIESAS